MNKVDIKRNQFGGKIPIKQPENLLEGEKVDPATIHIDDIPQPQPESDSDSEDELNFAMETEYAVGEDVLLDIISTKSKRKRDEFCSLLKI